MNYPARNIVFLLLIFPALCLAQDKWSLDRCIAHAYDNNIELKQQELNVKLAENRLLQSKVDLLPDLAAGAGQTYRFGRSVDPLTYEFTTENSKGSSFYGSSNIELFNGLRNLNTIKRNRLNLHVMLADYDRARNDLSLNITRLYLQILYNRELLEIAGHQVELTDLQLKTTQKLVNAGSLPQGDLLEIQAQKAGEELNMVNAKNDLSMSLLDLAQVLDLEDVESFDIESPSFIEGLIGSVELNSVEVYESALDMLPRIKSAELLVQYYQRNLEISKGAVSPKISMRASWGSGYSDQILDFQTNAIMPFRDQLDFASTTSVGINLEIPVFNNWAYRTDIKNSKIALMNSNYNLQLEKNRLRKEIQQAMADATASLEKYRATEKSLLSLEEAFTYTEKKYSAGLLTSLDYNLAKNKMAAAQSDLLQARYNYIFNIKILDFYRGIPVKLR